MKCANCGGILKFNVRHDGGADCEEEKNLRKALDAYMFEKWTEFNELAGKLSEAGKVRLARALYVP